jgi:hypothetical protein
VLQRVRDVAELLVELRDLKMPLHALLPRLDRLQLDEQHARQLGVAPRLRVVLVQPARGALPHGAPGRRRRLRPAAPARLRRVPRRRRRDCRTARIGVGRCGREHPLQKPPHVCLRAVGPIFGPSQHRLDGLERRRRVPQLVEPETRDARACATRLVALERRDASREQRYELAVSPLSLVEPLQRARELGVLGAQLVQLLEVLDGAVGPIGEVLRRLRRILQQIRQLLAGRRGEGTVVEGEEVVPPLGRVEQELEAVERPVRGGVELEHALEDAHDASRVLEPLLVELHRTLADRQGLIARERPCQDLLVQGRHFVGSPKRARQLLDAVP